MRTAAAQQGPLSGVKVVEFAALGPAPFCGMLLADMGADVVLVQRASTSPDPLELGAHAIVHRGKRALALNLKDPDDHATALALVAQSDILIEGLRPGVMERLGLGPEACLAAQPALVYGRMTGWGQSGPLAQHAGHDLNYAALSGAAWWSATPHSAPLPPPTLVGDLGGGALYLAMGVLAALLHARSSGQGQVVDAAIVDGSANLLNLLLSLHSAGLQPEARGSGLLDGPWWYGLYRCADAQWLSVAAVEPHFRAELLKALDLSEDPVLRDAHRPSQWPTARAHLAQILSSQTREHWLALLQARGAHDACCTPLLAPSAAAAHPHLQARGTYVEHQGVLQAAAAPRFEHTPSRALADIPQYDQHGAQIRAELQAQRRL
ncbi:CaiB/BaiF CoA transferase family protein [Roseateles sp. BYS180W]|uniref:CaiB/BaiF CoA transferase family protein n=1 Tax=Roseateles rivi TaxID=3299028 RepID=A0ABW7FWZ3_9BURK